MDLSWTDFFVLFFLPYYTKCISPWSFLSYKHTHIHSFSTVTRCLSLLLCIVSFKWVIEEHYVHCEFYPAVTWQMAGRSWGEETVCSISECMSVSMVTTRRVWNVLCSNMLYFPTVTRTESLSLSILLQTILSFQFHACGLKRLVRYSDE